MYDANERALRAAVHLLRSRLADTMEWLPHLTCAEQQLEGKRALIARNQKALDETAAVFAVPPVPVEPEPEEDA